MDDGGVDTVLKNDITSIHSSQIVLPDVIRVSEQNQVNQKEHNQNSFDSSRLIDFKRNPQSSLNMQLKPSIELRGLAS